MRVGDRSGRSRAVWVVVLAALIAPVACGSDDAPSLTDALVRAEDLPGEWAFFQPSSTPDDETDLCGAARERPRPVASASVGWAVSPDDGPIFGERIERFASSDDVSRLVGHELATPCEFGRDDGRWRTDEVEPGALAELGDTVRVFLVTSLDRSDSFNYQVVVGSGAIALLAVLNARTPDRALLDELVVIAWDRAAAARVVG